MTKYKSRMKMHVHVLSKALYERKVWVILKSSDWKKIYTKFPTVLADF